MEAVHRKKLQNNCTLIAELIFQFVEEITNSLCEVEVITEYMKQTVLCKSTPFQKAYELIDQLPSRGPYAFETFYEVCKYHKVWDACEFLYPGGKHYPPPASSSSNPLEDDDDLPTDWPTKEDNKNYKEGNVKIQGVDEKMRQIFSNSLRKGQLKIYPMMNSNPRGRLLIVNITEFERRKDWKREGAIYDQRAMDFLFQGLDFDTEFHRNQNAADIEKFLKEQGEEEYEKYDCLFVIIMSHGIDDKIFGKDGDYKKTHGKIEFSGVLTIDQIVQPFQNSKSLKNKPKLFFFQTCHAASGTKVAASEDTANYEKYSKSDLFIAKACSPGEEAHRSEENGSWYLRAIFYIFQRFAHKEDVATLLTWVRQLVAKCEEAHEGKTQVTMDINYLARKLYLFPKLKL